MPTNILQNNKLNFLKAAGKIGQLIQNKDWLLTGMGTPEAWPQSLLSSLGVILNSCTPMLLFWGPNNICFYNKEYLSLINNQKGFSAKLGMPGNDVFPETWKQVTPIIEKVMKAKPVNGTENYFLQEKVSKTLMAAHWNHHYSPVFDEKGEPTAVLVSFYVSEPIPAELKVQQKIKELLVKKDVETKAIIENAIFPISIIKADTFEILTANEAIIKIWGKGENVVGKKFTEIMPELKAQKVFKILKNVITSGETYTDTNQHFEIIKNGETVSSYFNYNFAPLKDENGKVYAVLNTAVDITEMTETRIKVEQTVKELKLFKFMTDNAADKLILIRKDASFAYVNKRVLSKWEYTKDEIKLLSVFDVDTLYQKRDFEKLFERSFKESSIQFETFHKNKSGKVFPVEVSVTGLTLDGEPYIFVIARDITERKKADRELKEAFAKLENSEKRFKDSVMQAPFGIALFRGENFMCEMANKVYYKIIDRTEEQFLNRPIFEALPEIKADVEPTFKEVYETGKAYYSYELPVYLKKSKGLVLSYFNLVYHPLMDDQHKCSGIMVVAVDITENVNAKLKLQESEKQFRNMIMQSPVAITILRGENFVFETANKTMLEKIIRYPEEEIIGKPLLTVFPELENQQYPQILQELYKKAGNKAIEEAPLKLSRNDAEEKMLIDVSFTSMPATDTTPAGIMITANNVTDKVEARKNVEVSNERLRIATEAANMGTFELDLQSKTLIHSPQLAVIFGENPNHKIDYETLRAKILEKDLENIVTPAFEKSIQTGYYFYEARIIKAPGSLNWIRTQGRVVFGENNTPLKMLGTTVDITEAKLFTEKLEKSEERFRLLANEIPQLIWTADSKGKVYYYNEAIFSYSGLSRETLYNEGWLKIVHPDDKEENVRLWTEAITNGTDFLFEHRFKRFDGAYRWQLSRAIPQRNEHGEIQAWVGSSTDIQELKEQGQQKDFFISMASHELKTPVTSIKGYVQMLQSLYKDSGDKILIDSLKVVDRQIVTLTKLITELLDISKIKSDGLEIRKESFEITDLINDILQEIMHTSPQYKIDFEIAQTAIVFADKDRIGQVLINLLTNAIKYAPDAKVIKVNCETANNWVTVSIKDEGIGISKKDQEKIFERFYRVEGKDEQTYPGFGIGLFIASEIINKHKGSIKVESELGKGSKFSFTLPIIN